jgi:hypothetical protein
MFGCVRCQKELHLFLLWLKSYHTSRLELTISILATRTFSPSYIYFVHRHVTQTHETVMNFADSASPQTCKHLIILNTWYVSEMGAFQGSIKEQWKEIFHDIRYLRQLMYSVQHASGKQGMQTVFWMGNHIERDDLEGRGIRWKITL